MELDCFEGCCQGCNRYSENLILRPINMCQPGTYTGLYCKECVDRLGRLGIVLTWEELKELDEKREANE